MILKDWVVVFDLDDTLISELEYQRSGILAVEDAIASIYGVTFEGRIQQALEEGVKDVWGWTCEQLNLPAEVKTSFLWIYRLHLPTIQLAKGVENLVSQLLNSQANVAILSDGRSITQRLKLLAVGLESLPLFISEDYQSTKPETDRYILVEEKWPRCKYVYIGDNASKDFAAPRARNWLTYGARWISPRVHNSSVYVPVSHQPHQWLHSPSQVIPSIASS